MSKKDRSRDFMSVLELAAELGMSDRQVRRWIRSGLLNVHRFGRRVRISSTDFDAFIQRMKRGRRDWPDQKHPRARSRKKKNGGGENTGE